MIYEVQCNGETITVRANNTTGAIDAAIRQRREVNEYDVQTVSVKERTTPLRVTYEEKEHVPKRVVDRAFQEDEEEDGGYWYVELTLTEWDEAFDDVETSLCSTDWDG